MVEAENPLRPKRYPQALRPRDLGAALQGLRQSSGLTQGALAARAGVSRKWISEMENGKATAEIGLVCRAFECLGAHLEVVLSPPPRGVIEEIFARLGEGSENR